MIITYVLSCHTSGWKKFRAYKGILFCYFGAVFKAIMGSLFAFLSFLIMIQAETRRNFVFFVVIYFNAPWIDIAYDGQVDSGIETRLEAFVYQAGEYAHSHALMSSHELPLIKI